MQSPDDNPVTSCSHLIVSLYFPPQELKVEMFGNMDNENDDLKSSSSHLFKGKTSTPLHIESTTSDDDLLAQALDGSGVLLPTAK